jgi:hypothetical protein
VRTLTYKVPLEWRVGARSAGGCRNSCEGQCEGGEADLAAIVYEAGVIALKRKLGTLGATERRKYHAKFAEEDKAEGIL